MPRMGRPPKNGEVKNRTIQFRLSESTMDKLNKSAEMRNITRTEIVEQGIDIIYQRAIKKN